MTVEVVGRPPRRGGRSPCRSPSRRRRRGASTPSIAPLRESGGRPWMPSSTKVPSSISSASRSRAVSFVPRVLQLDLLGAAAEASRALAGAPADPQASGAAATGRANQLARARRGVWSVGYRPRPLRLPPSRRTPSRPPRCRRSTSAIVSLARAGTRGASRERPCPSAGNIASLPRRMISGDLPASFSAHSRTEFSNSSSGTTRFHEARLGRPPTRSSARRAAAARSSSCAARLR